MSDPIEDTLADRQKSYGHPYDNFQVADQLHQDISKHFPDTGEEEFDRCLRQYLFYLASKLARLAKSPKHRDSYHDIGGYSRCMEMVLDRTDSTFESTSTIDVRIATGTYKDPSKHAGWEPK